MQLTDLKPLDTICSRKHIPFSFNPIYRPVEWIFNQGIISFQRSLYGDTSFIYDNHTRGVVGFNEAGVPVGFEWTWPVARFFEIEPWMLDPAYSRVYRTHIVQRHLPPSYMQQLICDVTGVLKRKHEGTKYDWLQGLGIILNQKWIQLSEQRKMCSPGWAEVLKYVLAFSGNMFPEVPLWRTPPAAWAHSDKFFCLNHSVTHILTTGGYQTLLPEPKETEAVTFERIGA